MKYLKLTNSIALIIPLFLGVLGIVEPISLYFVAYSTMLTGLLQIIVGIIFWKNQKENIHIKIYFLLVVTFFSLWYYNVNVNYIDALTWPLIFTPLLLCIYISIIIYSTKKITNMSFLTAKWKNLALFNYEVDAKILEQYIPKGTEIDIWNGKCYISLVGFMFENVKLLGLKIPFHINFKEVNLRFYVKRFENDEWKRGVVFIKEIVPKPALTVVANTIYKEHYQTLQMNHSITENKLEKVDYVYQWKIENKWNTILVETEKTPIEIEVNSEAEFITEHYYGYTKVNQEKTFEYEVKHSRWQQYEVTNYYLDVDFKKTYGKAFEFLNNQKPISVMLAVGSEISVENKKRI